MITIKFTQEEIDQLYEALENIPKEIYSECDTPDDLDKELLSGIDKLKDEANGLVSKRKKGNRWNRILESAKARNKLKEKS